jgi:hypothetical protein
MLKKLLLACVALPLLLAGCKEKCYKCVNYCVSCQYSYPDTTLTALVCSDVLGEEYFIEYVDSLQSPGLGWTCTDANPTRSDKFCGTQTQNNTELLQRKDQGWRCAPEF